MRVVCSCNPVLGHVYPLLPLASALRDAGHTVAFLSGAELAEPIERAGFELLVAGPAFDALVGEALARHPETSFATPDDQQRFGFERLFSEMRLESTMPDAVRQADAFVPDLVVNEVADFVGPLLAARADLPSTTAGVGLVLRDEWLALAAAAAAPHWESAGLTAPGDAGIYRGLYLNQLPRSLQRTSVDALPRVVDVRPVALGEGSALPADLDHLGRARALVYVTFGTVFGDPTVVRSVVEALRPLDVDVFVTVGPNGDPTALDGAHDHLDVRRFVPQGALLDRAVLVITHGGVGSVVGPLRFGVPLVVVPMGADQQENAEQIAAARVGRMIDAADLTADALLAVVIDVLEDADIARAAVAMRDEIAAMPAPSEVVAVLEALAG